MYSAFELDLGWVAPPDNPIHGFASSEQQEWVEEIRQAQGSDNFYKYGYVKGPLGQIVQVGVLANHIQALTDQFSYQTVVDDLATSAGIVYAGVIDTNRVNIAHSNPDWIGVTLNDDGTIAAAVRGERYATEYFYEAGGVTVYDVLLPLIIDGQHVGAVNIGLPMENVYDQYSRNEGTGLL